MDTLWFVTTYHWAERSYSLYQYATVRIRTKARPTGEQIRTLMRLNSVPAAFVYCESDLPFHAPETIHAWRDDLVPVCEPALSIMARLSK